GTLDLLVHLDDVGARRRGGLGITRSGIGFRLPRPVLLADDAVTLDFLVDLDGHWPAPGVAYPVQASRLPARWAERRSRGLRVAGAALGSRLAGRRLAGGGLAGDCLAGRRLLCRRPLGRRLFRGGLLRSGLPGRRLFGNGC